MGEWAEGVGLMQRVAFPQYLYFRVIIGASIKTAGSVVGPEADPVPGPEGTKPINYAGYSYAAHFRMQTQNNDEMSDMDNILHGIVFPPRSEFLQRRYDAASSPRHFL